MKIRKIIDKRIHEIEFLNKAQLEKKLINNISNLDILIFDRSHLHASSSNIKGKKIGLTTFTKK